MYILWDYTEYTYSKHTKLIATIYANTISQYMLQESSYLYKSPLQMIKMNLMNGRYTSYISWELEPEFHQPGSS